MSRQPILDAILDQVPVRGALDDLPKLQGVRLRLSLLCIALPISASIALPFAYLALWSVRGTEVIGVLNPEISLHWFKVFLSDPNWRMEMLYSTVLATVVSMIGACLLSVHFYLSRYLSRTYERLVLGAIVLMLLLPSVIYAIALQTVGATLHIPEFCLLACGHLAVVIPIQYFVLEGAQESIASEVLFAGTSLGADHVRNFVAVYWPLSRTGLWSAIVVGFFLSFDELVIASFVINSSFATVPRHLWDRIGSEMDPIPGVVSILVFVIYLIQAGCAVLLRRRGFRRTKSS